MNGDNGDSGDEDAPGRSGAGDRVRRWPPPVWCTWLLLGALAGVYAAQASAGLEKSIWAAGLVKERVREGETWRLWTCVCLHGGLLHLLVNGMALKNLGAAIEVLGHWSHLAIVFLVTGIAGSVASQTLTPEGVSVGASGGLMGLLGFLVVVAFRRRRVLAGGFLRSLLLNVLLMAAVGYFARDYIDNAAHGGGFAAGLVLGVALVPVRGWSLPIVPGRFVRTLGSLALAAIVVGAAFTAWKVVERRAPRGGQTWAEVSAMRNVSTTSDTVSAWSSRERR